jgi:hypothetical protein
VTLAAATALLLYLPTRRSRYFGNTVPLLLALLFFTLITPGISSEPTLWALPFLLTFIAGVFADFLETRYRPVLAGGAGFLLVLSRLSLFRCPEAPPAFAWACAGLFSRARRTWLAAHKLFKEKDLE